MEVFQGALWLLSALAAYHVVENPGGMLFSQNQCQACQTQWPCACNSVWDALPSLSAEACRDSMNHTDQDRSMLCLRISADPSGPHGSATGHCDEWNIRAGMKRKAQTWHDVKGRRNVGWLSLQSALALMPQAWANDRQCLLSLGFPQADGCCGFSSTLPCFSLSSRLRWLGIQFAEVYLRGTWWRDKLCDSSFTSYLSTSLTDQSSQGTNFNHRQESSSQSRQHTHGVVARGACGGEQAPQSQATRQARR